MTRLRPPASFPLRQWLIIVLPMATMMLLIVLLAAHQIHILTSWSQAITSLQEALPVHPGLDMLQAAYMSAQDAWRLQVVLMVCLGLTLLTLALLDVWRLVRQMDASRRHASMVQEAERRRIAQDLHDGVVQSLVDLKRHFDPHRLDTIIGSIQRVCQNLKPQILDDLGFAASLAELAADLRQDGADEGEGTTVLLCVDEATVSALTPEVTLPLFRVVQELFNNIRRHAHASHVWVTLGPLPDAGGLRLLVRDNGQGIHAAPPRRRRGLGLTGIEERVADLGGQVRLHSRPGQGTTVVVDVPLPSHRTRLPWPGRH